MLIEKVKDLAEYALRDMGKPIGISGFKLAESLLDSLKGKLPTIADLEAKLSQVEASIESGSTKPRRETTAAEGVSPKGKRKP